MQITCLGHAGLHIETRYGTILCDPWRSPAYFGSWFVFPDNSGLDWDRYGKVDYLYVSHLHQDHFDPALLSEHTDKARYLRRYAARMRDRMAADALRWPAGGVDVLAELKAWFEPLLELAGHIRAGVGGPVLLRAGACS